MADYHEVSKGRIAILLNRPIPGPRIVPDTLARAGFDVTAHEGPGPEEYYGTASRTARS